MNSEIVQALLKILSNHVKSALAEPLKANKTEQGSEEGLNTKVAMGICSLLHLYLGDGVQKYHEQSKQLILALQLHYFIGSGRNSKV